MIGRLAWVPLLLVVVACGANDDEDGGLLPVDAGQSDSGAGDTGSTDTGPRDTGGRDTGAGDSGIDDAGAVDLGADGSVSDLGFGDGPTVDAADAGDAGAGDAEPTDSGPADAGPSDGGCVPSGVEICDDLDNDCDGLTDNVDSAGDGIYDCLRIALFGTQGANGSSNFVAWLQTNGVTVARIQTDTATLTPTLLAQYDVVILDRLIRDYAPGEGTLMRTWIEGGGALMSLTGYTGGATDRTRPNQLMAEIGMEYLPGLISGPVTTFIPHATTSSLTSVTFSGGFPIGELAAAASSTTTVVATLPAGPVAVAVERGFGRAFVWGDEWVTFDAQWTNLPEIRIFWTNVLAWLTHFR